MSRQLHSFPRRIMNIKSFSEKGRGRFESLNFLTLCLYLVYCWVLLLPVEYGIGRPIERRKKPISHFFRIRPLRHRGEELGLIACAELSPLPLLVPGFHLCAPRSLSNFSCPLRCGGPYRGGERVGRLTERGTGFVDYSTSRIRRSYYAKENLSMRFFRHYNLNHFLGFFP